MGLIIKKSECKRRVDYLSQLESELEDLLFLRDTKSCRIISHKDIEKKATRKSEASVVKNTSKISAIINISFEEIRNNDRTFQTWVARN